MSDRKYHTETVTLETDTKDLGKILEQLDTTLDYDDCTYSGKFYHRVATGYVTSADYMGEVTRSDVESVTYKVTYLGTESESSGLVIDRNGINTDGLPGKVLPYALAPSAHAAADYSFETTTPQDYYKSTSYENVYGSQYNYGGKNVVDYQIPNLEYGCPSTTMTGVMERTILPGLQQSVATGGGGYGVAGGGPITVLVEADSPGSAGTQTPTTPTVQQPAYTSAEGMAYKDGSIGSIKDLKRGDTIIYTTMYGTQTYAVTLVKTIPNTDWSYLQATADNRITITTCLADHPESRVVVQAVEVRS